jgi:hypothetical protein
LQHYFERHSFFCSDLSLFGHFDIVSGEQTDLMVGFAHRRAHGLPRDEAHGIVLSIFLSHRFDGFNQGY